MILLNWNVNGIRARFEQVAQLLSTYSPDVVTLQESKIKATDFDKIELDFFNLGYECYLSPHPSNFHGVLTLVKAGVHSSVDTKVIEPGRVLSTIIDGIEVVNCYINQGQSLDSPEYPIKLDLMRRLALTKFEPKTILAGDFNITESDKDVWSTKSWNSTTVACTPTERKAFAELLKQFNNHEPTTKNRFTWYGYRTDWRQYETGVPTENCEGKYGIKCDHILSNYSSTKMDILLHMRFPIKGTFTPSDHVPMLIIGV